MTGDPGRVTAAQPLSRVSHWALGKQCIFTFGEQYFDPANLLGEGEGGQRLSPGPDCPSSVNPWFLNVYHTAIKLLWKNVNLRNTKWFLCFFVIFLSSIELFLYKTVSETAHADRTRFARGSQNMIAARRYSRRRNSVWLLHIFAPYFSAPWSWTVS